MSSASRPLPPRPLAGRILRVVAWAGLTLGLTFLSDLFLLSQLPQSAAFLQRTLMYGYPVIQAKVIPALLLAVVTVLVIGFALWRLRATSRRLVYSGLLVAAMLVTDAVILAYVSPNLADPLLVLPADSLHDLGVVLLAAGVVPVVVGLALWWVRSWRWLGLGYAAVGCVLAYLAWDDAAVLQPTSLAQISPAFPEADASYAVLMQYGKDHPLAKNFYSSTERNQRIYQHGLLVGANKPAEWPAWLKAHRADVEADWAGLAPVRGWIAELNRFDRIGDLMPADIHAEIIAFGPLRAYSHHASEIAGLQALDGHGDAAIETLLPLIQVSRKLEPSSRSLVRTMIARIMQRMATDTACFVLDTTPVSPAMRARLTAALSLGIGGEPGVRHLLAIENTLFVEGVAREPLGSLPSFRRRQPVLDVSLNLARPFLFNYRHTANERQALNDRLEFFALHRDLKGLQAFQNTLSRNEARLGFKNLMGDYLIGASMPAYIKVVQAYWDIEDQRLALIARLDQPMPAPGTGTTGGTVAVAR